jgi:hypothetical protein
MNIFNIFKDNPRRLFYKKVVIFITVNKIFYVKKGQLGGELIFFIGKDICYYVVNICPAKQLFNNNKRKKLHKKIHRPAAGE